MSGQVWRGSAGEYQADERAGVARLIFQRPNLGLYQNGYHKQYRLPAEKQSGTERLSVFFLVAAGRGEAPLADGGGGGKQLSVA